MNKILIIRFSSIGDIVLISPVIRCIKIQSPEAEIHFLTKNKFSKINSANPYLSKIINFQSSLNEVIGELKEEKYDLIIDLHNNIRSHKIKLLLNRNSSTFKKLNTKKWLFTNFKIDLLPDVHIVERYLETVKHYGISYDGRGLDYFIPETEDVVLNDVFPDLKKSYIAFSIGGAHNTKQIPTQKLLEIIKKLELPVILLGGKNDFEQAKIIVKNTNKKVWNACGMFSLHQSASIIKQSQIVITTDTGLMHIAAAFNKKIISIWGNTVPKFGMYPFMPDGLEDFSKIIEVNNLKCRPCSKIGYKKCPKTHFKCMKNILVEKVIQTLNKTITKTSII